MTSIADNWHSTKVTLSRWYRDNNGHWQRLGNPWEGVIGHSGLAWGIGLAPSREGPRKHEGDGASPAGAFLIKTEFGFEMRPGQMHDHLPYRALTDTTECVDDPKSASYNLLVERTGSADWTSSEHMRSVPQYAVGAFIGYNPKRVPGAGSCIFLHVWDGPDSTTVGCTAMDEHKLRELLGRMSDKAVFVQLPKAEYDALREPWGLPAQ